MAKKLGFFENFFIRTICDMSDKSIEIVEEGFDALDSMHADEWEDNVKKLKKSVVPKSEIEQYTKKCIKECPTIKERIKEKEVKNKMKAEKKRMKSAKYL